MRRYLLALAVCAALALTGWPAQAQTCGDLTVSNASIAMNSTGWVNTSTGYAGTVSWSTANSGFHTIDHIVYFVCQYYDTATSAWVTYSANVFEVTAPNGNYSHSVDFSFDMTKGIPAGSYNFAVFIATGTTSTVGSTLASAGTSGYAGMVSWSASAADCPPPVAPAPPEDPCDDGMGGGDGTGDGGSDPLPNPEPPPPEDPGNDPPIVYPALPPAGPPGPGNIKANRIGGD